MKKFIYLVVVVLFFSVATVNAADIGRIKIRPAKSGLLYWHHTFNEFELDEVQFNLTVPVEQRDEKWVNLSAGYNVKVKGVDVWPYPGINISTAEHFSVLSVCLDFNMRKKTDAQVIQTRQYLEMNSDWDNESVSWFGREYWIRKLSPEWWVGVQTEHTKMHGQEFAICPGVCFEYYFTDHCCLRTYFGINIESPFDKKGWIELKVVGK